MKLNRTEVQVTSKDNSGRLPQELKIMISKVKIAKGHQEKTLKLQTLLQKSNKYNDREGSQRNRKNNINRLK